LDDFAFGRSLENPQSRPMETKPGEYRRPLAEGPSGLEAQRAAENPENILPTKAERIVTA